MKKISDKLLEQTLKDFVEIDDLTYIKDRCFAVIFKTEMSVKKYVEFIKKTFEFEVSVSTVREWRAEFDEKNKVQKEKPEDHQNEAISDGDISQQQSNGN
nr:hypothetical protein [uncultured Campylobacter sp.]